MNKIELERYENFVSEYYPHTYLLNTRYLRDIQDVIHNNIQFIKFLRANDCEISHERKILYDTFYLLNLRGLYHFPANDSYVNGVIIRSIVENLMRISVALLKCNGISVLDASFSSLKSALDNKGFQYKHKDFYENLCSYFGTYSKDVHGENIYKLLEQEFLASIRKSENSNHLLKILKAHKTLNKYIPLCFLQISGIKSVNLNAAERSKLLDIIGENDYKTFLDKY